MTEQEYKEQIYAKVKTVETKDDLVNLIDEITSYKHDYGTIVYGCMAAMKAAFRVVDNGPQGGITGFQAGCLGWECIHEFMAIDSPARLVDYNHMLYPQYQDNFEKTITSDTWDHLQKKAKEELASGKAEGAHPDVVGHWKTIAEGRIPFGYSIK